MTASSEQTILKSDDAEGQGLKPAGAGAAIDANVLKPADWSAANRKDMAGGDGAQAADAAAKANIPALTIDSAPSAAEILGSRTASAQDKLKAAESLARAGQTTVEIVEADGQKRQLTIELESAGKRTLVHVYAQDESGKDRVVLRAVKEADGSFAQEQTESGRKVSFYGEWWSKNMAERSVLADKGGPVPGASASTASELYQPRRNEIPVPVQVARTDTVYPPTGADPANDSTRLNQLFEGVAQRAGYSRRLTQLDNGAVYFRSGMAVDADGSPRARQIDPYGQTRTSLRHEGGASVNAEATNYFVLPYGKYKQFGVKLGDIAAVRYGDQVRFAVFADVGPGHKLGEGSMALARSLGMSSSPISGGTQRAEVEYLVFPRSGNGTPLHNDAHEDLGRHYLGKTYRQLRSSQS